MIERLKERNVYARNYLGYIDRATVVNRELPSFAEVIDKVNEIIDNINSKEQTQKESD